MLEPQPVPDMPDRDGGLSPESAGRASDLAGVWDRHGAAVYALAALLFEDVRDAEDVAVQAILDACTPAYRAPEVGLRELARYVYVLWLRRGAEPSLAGLSSLQRTAIALGFLGDHTYREAAELMSLPAGEVADLIRSGLHAV